MRTERDRFHEELTRLNQPGNEQSVEGQLPVVELAPLAFTVNDRFALRKELAWLDCKRKTTTEFPLQLAVTRSLWSWLSPLTMCCCKVM